MISKLWNKFKAWHNKPHVTVHPQQAIATDEGFKVVEQPKQTKPHIKLCDYLGKRRYRIDEFDFNRVYDNDYRKHVDAAIKFCTRLNKKEGRL